MSPKVIEQRDRRTEASRQARRTMQDTEKRGKEGERRSKEKKHWMEKRGKEGERRSKEKKQSDGPCVGWGGVGWGGVGWGGGEDNLDIEC